ncbi:FAD-dependent oxidoreductase [Reinekea blandensis]|uniref:D-amino-acid oxidase n=1 Tax=Reinekea blandensis MED297 TaxID=314283 RepID=A4BCN8_9GAMM|nr:FAD-dependent oxidoreductase [Reinekea blandensis]EAR09970.1 thiamine biosynthesis protein ThiO [Reinekea sp. MED297] [Reinekea blandensis MED297]
MKIAIIGAGVLGRLIALRLTEQPHQVTLIDRQPLHQPDNAAWVSAGMLCPLGEIIHAPREVVQMGWHSLSLWPDILAGLSDEADVYFQQNGSWVVAFDQDRQCFAQWQQQFLNNPHVSADQVAWLQSEAVHNQEPALSGFRQAALLKAEGQLCNRSFILASADKLRRQATIVEQDVTRAHLDDLQTHFDWVIDCRGAGAIGSDWPESSVDLRGVRGEVIRVRCNEVTLQRPVRVLHPQASIYIVPKPNHEFVVGATEIESHSEHPITVQSTLELLSTLYCVHPGFAEASILEARVGIRSAYADNQPKVSQHDNLIQVNGAYRHGWLTGPALAEQTLRRLEVA